MGEAEVLSDVETVRWHELAGVVGELRSYGVLRGEGESEDVVQQSEDGGEDDGSFGADAVVGKRGITLDRKPISLTAYPTVSCTVFGGGEAA